MPFGLLIGRAVYAIDTSVVGRGATARVPSATMAPTSRRSLRLLHQSTASTSTPTAAVTTTTTPLISVGKVSKNSKRSSKPAPKSIKPATASTSSPRPTSTSQPRAKSELPELTLQDVAAWRAWLDSNESGSDGVWLVIAKGGSTVPTSITRPQALDEALCSGWIDGQARSRDESTYLQRYTPRRAKSVWSAINVGYVARLRAEGRMRPRGEEEVSKAMVDGRWERAYPGSKDMEVPDELLELLDKEPEARKIVDGFTPAQRYVALLPVAQATTDGLRLKRIEALAKKLIEEASNNIM